MIKNISHHHNSKPNFPPIIELTKGVYKQWLPIQRNLPQCERLGLGHKIDCLFLELLDTLRKASFSPINSKIPLLDSSLTIIDSLRFFVQLCWEVKLLPTKQYSIIGQGIENIGRMTGGWRKSLLAKTSRHWREEKK